LYPEERVLQNVTHVSIFTNGAKYSKIKKRQTIYPQPGRGGGRSYRI
jgi:hypothetical protein